MMLISLRFLGVLWVSAVKLGQQFTFTAETARTQR
jgi:hypothetical protein